jgi:predicted transposase/invertase (TIGR01784 family)
METKIDTDKKTKRTMYLDPKNDLTFKRVFGEHPDLLISFLNALMPLSSEHQIKEIEYLSPEQVPDIPGKKNSIVDVKCKDKSGRAFIIEMQMFWTDDFMSRILFNASKAYVRQLDKGESYHKLQPVYTLAILNENFDNAEKNSDKFYHHFQIINKENNEEIIKGLEFVLVELQKFTSDKWSDRELARLWLRFLKEVNEGMSELPPEMANNKQIRQAAELCEAIGFTPEELAAYDAYWDWVRTEKTIREGALAKGLAEGEAIGLEKGLEKGEAIGLKKGKAIGLKKGEALGIEKGKAEGLAEGEALGMEKAVINSHHACLPLETIATITGLTPGQITEILKNHDLI